MKKEKNFLKEFFEFSYRILIINLCFIITSFPFFVIYIFVIPSFENILFFVISSLPLGASLVATFGVCRKFIEDKDLSIVSQFLKDYKTNFKSATAFWLTQVTIIFVFLLNYRYVTETGDMRFLFPFYLLGILSCLLVSTLAFPILSRFEVKIQSLYQVSFYCLVRYLRVTMINVGIIVAALLTGMQFPIFTGIFIFSTTCYLISHNVNNMLKELEEMNEKITT